MKKVFFALGFLPLLSAAQNKPNVIIINADDLGFGDISCNGYGVIETPNIDRVASAGIRMTNAHSTSATSTPSRFSLLTGAYAWRTPGTGIATGDAAMIIRPEMTTLPDMFKRSGYITAAVGKWHLGIGNKTGMQSWNKKITPALDSIGFDYSFIMAATGDRVPCVYIEQANVVNLDPTDPIEVSYTTPFEGEPTGKSNPELLRLHPSHGHNQAIVDSIPRIGYMRGGKSALWKDELIADRITEKAVEFICKNADSTFFLYFATNDIHVPRVPHWRFKGKSGLGDRGDAILEFDWSVGQIVRTLDSLGIANNTLLIITSDNGPVVDDGYIDRAKELLGKHKPAGPYRGNKYSIYKAGTCVPFIARWKNGIKAKQVSNASINQVDLYATFATLCGTQLGEKEALDSQNQLNALVGKDKKGRKWTVEDGYSRSVTVGNWKYIKPTDKYPSYFEATDIESGCHPYAQLFNLKNDPIEKVNLAEKHPKKVEYLARFLRSVEENN